MYSLDKIELRQNMRWIYKPRGSVGKSTKRGMALINPFPRRAVIFEFDRLK